MARVERERKREKIREFRISRGEKKRKKSFVLL